MHTQINARRRRNERKRCYATAQKFEERICTRGSKQEKSKKKKIVDAYELKNSLSKDSKSSLQRKTREQH